MHIEEFKVTGYALQVKSDMLDAANDNDSIRIHEELLNFFWSRFSNSKAKKPIPTQMAESATLKAGQGLKICQGRKGR